MIGRSSRWGFSSRRRCRKSSKDRTRLLRSEWLEPRELLSGVGYPFLGREAFAVALPPGAMVGKAAATTSGPTVAQGIIINGNQNVTCTWAAVSVLGNENGNDAGLRYTWSVTGAPPGGKATFNINGINAAKNAIVTFTEAGTYTLTATIADSSGRSVSTSKSVLVMDVVYSMKNLPAPVTVTGKSLQPAVPTFIDQFGKVMATPPLLWSLYACPPAAPAPTFTTNGAATTVTFGMAGTYMLYARDTTQSGVFFYVTASVNQTLTSIAVSPSACSVILGTTQQFTAQGLDQFGRPMATLPPIAWKASSGTISTAGLFTAPSTGSACTVTAVSGTLTGTAAVTLKAASPTPTPTPTPQNTTVAALVQSLDADGSISRNDMIEILRSVAADGTLSAANFASLKTILSEAVTLNMPSYVQVLASDVINGNPANATYLGQTLGNLAVGSTATHLTELIDKWFLGTDTPATGGYAYATLSAATCSNLFTAGSPSTNDEKQGLLGDCYLISSLGAIANSAPAAISNMIIDNGVDAQTGIHSWTVRFYDNGVADYVTVDNQLPVSGSTLVFDGYGTSISSPKGLWIALIEKAYAEWNQTGKEGRNGQNSYAAIAGGWMADVDAQVLGQNAASYDLSSTSDKQALVAGMTAKMAVTIATDGSSNSGDTLPYGLYGNHAYAIIGYNSAAGTFTLYNPWGVDQPPQALTWAQLQTVTDGFVVANASQTKPIAGSTLHAAIGSALAPQLAGSVLSSAQPVAAAASAAASPSAGYSTAAAEASRRLFEGLGIGGLPSSHWTGNADAAAGSLSAAAVDATLAADGLLPQSELCPRLV